MARRVFFSFHYADIMNANIVRNSGQFKPTSETGWSRESGRFSRRSWSGGSEPRF
jgi:hypothetical protein